MTQSDDSYLRGWQARQADALEVAKAWQAARSSEAKHAAQRLVDALGVTRVVLFGSLALGKAGPGSDVDLWVEGLDKAHYLEAIALVRELIRGAEVDLVPAEWASPALRERVEYEGVVIGGC